MPITHSGLLETDGETWWNSVDQMVLKSRLTQSKSHWIIPRFVFVSVQTMVVGSKFYTMPFFSKEKGESLPLTR